MELIKAENMKAAFQNMFNLYAHELSLYNPWLSTQLDTNGNYLSKQVDDYLCEEQF